MKYRQGSHTKYKIEYHFVWVTKYRYHVLVGDLALRVRELVWARGYFCVTAGELTKEMIEEYLSHHFEPKPHDGFDIDP